MQKLTLLLILLIFCGAILLPASSMAAGKSEAAKSATVLKSKVSGSTAVIKQVRESSDFSLFRLVKTIILTRWNVDGIVKNRQDKPDQPQKGYGPQWYREYIEIRDNGWEPVDM